MSNNRRIKITNFNVLAFFQDTASIAPIFYFPFPYQGISASTHTYPQVTVRCGVITGIGGVIQVDFFPKSIDEPGLTGYTCMEVALAVDWQRGLFTVCFYQGVFGKKDGRRPTEEKLLYTGGGIAKFILGRECPDNAPDNTAGMTIDVIENYIIEGNCSASAVVFYNWSTSKIAESRVNGFWIVKNGIKIGTNQASGHICWTGNDLRT